MSTAVDISALRVSIPRGVMCTRISQFLRDSVGLCVIDYNVISVGSSCITRRFAIEYHTEKKLQLVCLLF